MVAADREVQEQIGIAGMVTAVDNLDGVASGGQVQLEGGRGRGGERGGAGDDAQLQSPRRAVQRRWRQRPDDLVLDRLVNRASGDDQQVDVATGRCEAAEHGRAVQIHADQRGTEELGRACGEGLEVGL